MMFRHDPPRLLDPKSGSPKLLRDALRAGRDDLPRPDEIDRMAERLAAAIQVPPVAGPMNVPSLPAPRGFWKWPVLKFGGPMLLAAAVGGGIWMAAGPRPWTSRFSSDTSALDSASSERISAEPPRIRPAPVVEVQPTADPSPPHEAESEPPRRSPTQDKPPASVRPPPPAPADSAPAAAAVPPLPAAEDTEVRLLHKAQDDAESNPEGALVRVAEHERRFASGVLVQEREVLAITALMRLGRAAEAHDRAAAFRDRFPGSAYLPKIDALLARHGGGPAADR
jgi:hypothetical protein